ncbi:MAG: hypothetical protein MZV63_02580 [Marinilabiliales bacterium]|nr:hypothetical protein [Marinilabiliales bacterium]
MRSYRSVIAQLEASGIDRSQLTIWDRREFELTDAGFTAENYPGIRIVGTEQMDKDGLYYGKDGKLYGEHMIDRDWYYWADVEGEYDEYTMPYMVNGGKYSYFTKIVTQDLDKIINIPILKNAGRDSDTGAEEPGLRISLQYRQAPCKTVE